MNRIDLTYGKNSFCFTMNETKESIAKRVEDHKKSLDKINKHKDSPGGFSCSVNASQVYKDYEVAKKKAEDAK